MASDYYDLLGVNRNASEDDLKRAYRRLARELHPDANGGDEASEARFKEVTLAYETLRDPERRRRYDMFGPEAVRGQGGGPGASMGDPFGYGGNIGDIFEAFFGGGGGFSQQTRPGARRGGDAEVLLQLSLEEAAFGARRDVTVKLPVTCSTCGGSGARPGTSPTSCPECRGTGQVQRVRQSILGQMLTQTTCGRCHGLGEVISSPCSDCRGEGRLTEERTLSVEVPAGVDDGATLRVAGAGPAAVRGGVPGDLFVHLKVAPDPRFERAGNDLVTEIHISFAQAALGAELEIETLEGNEVLEVTAGTQSDTVLRLGGKGVPRLRARGRGDLLVRIVVDTPSRISKEEDELFRRLAALRGEEVASPDTGLLSRLRSSFH
ncbi:MAG: molecular chaperone DnaJ [Actinomycetota bacterium]|nr:molecular chaperone DnaJ [Actinomycetota bacterium]